MKMTIKLVEYSKGTYKQWKSLPSAPRFVILGTVSMETVSMETMSPLNCLPQKEKSLTKRPG